MSTIATWWPAFCWVPAMFLVLWAIPRYYQTHRWRDAYILMYLVEAITPFVIFNNTPLGRLLPFPFIAAGWATAIILAVLTFRAFIIRSRRESGP